MSKLFEAELLAFLNELETAEELVECFTDGEMTLVDRDLAEKVLEARNRLPEGRFATLNQLDAVPEVTAGLIKKAFEFLPGLLGLLPSEHPVLMVPLRLETRIVGQALCVRIYPDQISVDAHDPRLTDTELEAGVRYRKELEKAPRTSVDAQGAWRKLAKQFGPERAAWIARVVFDSSVTISPVPERQAWSIRPMLAVLPDRFVVYAKPVDGPMQCRRGKRIQSGLAYASDPQRATTSEREHRRALLHSKSEWVQDFEAAIKCGMAVRLAQPGGIDFSKGFRTVVVVGVGIATATEGQDALTQLLDHHHYSTGWAVLNYGTPTNNTRLSKSGHSESTEDREVSYGVEVAGAPNIDDPRTSGARLARALGLNPHHFKHVANAGDTADSYAEDMQTALWPATGDYFLRYLLPGVVTDEGLQRLARHFTRHVRAAGPLPAIRVGNQPYGILPVCSVQAKSEASACGWVASAKDNPSEPAGRDFDAALHDTLSRLFVKWFEWANDPSRVPRIKTTADNGTSPIDDDKALLEILSMEPYSSDYRLRPFVDEGLAGWLLLAMRGEIFGPKSPFAALPDNPLSWSRKWFARWDELRSMTARYLSELTGAGADTLRDAPLLRLFGWWSVNDLDLAVTQHAQDAGREVPAEYLRELLQGTGLENPKTLLRELLQRSLKLAPRSSIEESAVRSAISRLVSPAVGDSTDTASLLEYFNSVRSPEQIVRLVVNDPSHGKSSARAYGVRLSLAKRILEERAKLPGGVFTSIGQLDSLLGVGDDTLHDIVHAFPTRQVQTDVDTLFRQTLDLCSHRLDAWFTSLATKRLSAMRERTPTGIHLGAYGYVENLIPEAERKSDGFIHTPSLAQAKAAAVVHSAYLTHDYGPDVPNPARINLTSARVRQALQIIEGMREGQPLGALLGYQFERELTERGRAEYIDEFRKAFPIVANKERGPEDGKAVEAVAARNVVDGLALARSWQEPDPSSSEEGALSEFRSPAENDEEKSDVRQAFDSVCGSLDAVADLMLYEGVYHAAQGNYARAGAALDVLSGNAFPQQIESMSTPISGKSLAHRVCLTFPPCKAPPSGPRAKAEPRIAGWISKLFEEMDAVDEDELDLDAVGASFTFDSNRLNVNRLKINEARLDGALRADLVSVLGGSEEKAATAIAEFVNTHRPLKNINDLKAIPELAQTALDSVKAWAADALAAELSELPGMSADGSAKVAQYVIERGPLGSKEDFKTIQEIDAKTREALERWAWTGKDGEPPTYMRINVNEATKEELLDIGLSEDEAEWIIGARSSGPIERMSEMASGDIRRIRLDKFRRWITTGKSAISLKEIMADPAFPELNAEPVDFLYLCASLPRAIDAFEGASPLPNAAETEIEQRVAYWIRSEFGLHAEERVQIGYSRPPGDYANGLGEALEVGRQILAALGAGKTLRPENLSPAAGFAPPAAASPSDADATGDETEPTQPAFTEPDIVDLECRCGAIKGLFDDLLGGLGAPVAESATLDARMALRDRLLLASRLGVAGAIPTGRGSPVVELETRRKAVVAELMRRLEQHETSMAGLASSVDFNRQIDLRVEAMKALFGGALTVLPECSVPRNSELAGAFDPEKEKTLLCGLGEPRVRLWLQQAAVAHPALLELEDTLLATTLWQQSAKGSAKPLFQLRVAQFPGGRPWLALDDAERSAGATGTSEPEADRGKLSIVVAVAGEGAVFDDVGSSVEYATTAGLLLDQWDERIPSDEVTTGISLHYDGPSAQAPQCLLLAVPSQPGRSHWHIDDLEATVRDTMDLAKVRLVDPDAMGASKPAKGERLGAGLMFPSLMLPVDPNRPHGSRETARKLTQFLRPTQR